MRYSWDLIGFNKISMGFTGIWIIESRTSKPERVTYILEMPNWFQVSVDTWIPSWIPQDVFWQLFGFLSNPVPVTKVYTTRLLLAYGYSPLHWHIPGENLSFSHRVSGWLDHHCWIKALRQLSGNVARAPRDCHFHVELWKKVMGKQSSSNPKSWMISFLWWNRWCETGDPPWSESPMA